MPKLETDDFTWGMTEFTTRQDSTYRCAAVYCIDKRSGMNFQALVEVDSLEFERMGFGAAVDFMRDNVQAALVDLSRLVTDYYGDICQKLPESQT